MRRRFALTGRLVIDVRCVSVRVPASFQTHLSHRNHRTLEERLQNYSKVVSALILSSKHQPLGLRLTATTRQHSVFVPERHQPRTGNDHQIHVQVHIQSFAQAHHHVTRVRCASKYHQRTRVRLAEAQSWRFKAKLYPLCFSMSK